MGMALAHRCTRTSRNVCGNECGVNVLWFVCVCVCVSACLCLCCDSTTLAQEFAVFNTWHADIPGPTLVNRAYIDSATSAGEFFGGGIAGG